MILSSWFNNIETVLTAQVLLNVAIAIAILVIGLFIAKRATAALSRVSALDTPQRLLLTKLVYYGLFILAVTAALSQIGVDLRVVLGAAGILTVAIGFAAQTSASNLISGFFLMAERPFTVGDIVSVGDIKGEVMSIDLLSSKIRTFNNLMVRIPNETLVKSNIVNLSYFPIRRIDLTVGVGYDSDLAKVEKVLKGIAHNHPLCLADPNPVFLCSGFGDSAINIQFQAWVLTQNLQALQNDMYREIQESFSRAGINIPYPTRTLVSVSGQQG